MNTAPFYKNTTFKVSKMWKMLLPHAWGEKKKGRNKKKFKHFLIIFYYPWITLPKYYFLFHPFKIYRMYAQFNIHYKYVLRVPPVMGG